MPDQRENNKRQLPKDYEQRGVVDQVIVPSMIAASAGFGAGVGKPVGEAIVAKVTKPKDPPVDK
jgi:hypothetical protein